MRFGPVCVDPGSYLAAGQQGSEIRHDHVFDTAVGRADDRAALDHVIERELMSGQKSFLFLLRIWCRFTTERGDKRPETILRMTVVKLCFPGFDGRKTPQDQHSGIVPYKGPEAVRQSNSFLCHGLTADDA